MRPALTTILAICWMQIGIYPANCNNPEVSRRRMLIYRIVEEVEVDVVQCKYYDFKHPALTYYDITKNCLVSPKTGIFVDKWEERNNINGPVSLVDMKQYKAKADLVRNEIKLRSGTICRYDRGFCYDAMENGNYAAVWEVKGRAHQKPVNSCPESLDHIFYGAVDIWDFSEKRLKYLIYSDDNRGKAFYLRLMKKIDCRNIETWITEGDSFVVSSLRLTPILKDTSLLNQQYFPLKSLKSVAEAIMKNVELQDYPLDFNNQMSTVYFETPENARILFQKLREEIDMKIELVSKNVKGSSFDVNNYLSEIDSLKQSVIEKSNEIENILKKLERTEGDLRVTQNDVSNFQKLVNSFSTTYNKDIVDFNNTLSEINNNINTESERILMLIAAKNVEFMQKFQQLNSFVKNQVINVATKSELAERLSDLEGDINELLNKQTTQLNILLVKDEKFEHSLNALRNYNTDLKKDFEIVKKEYDSKLGFLEKKVNDNCDLLKKSLKKVLEQISERKCASGTDSKIAELRKNIEDFKISSKSDSEISFNNIRETFEKISQNSVTKEEFFNLQAQIDVMNRYVEDIEWDILKNIKTDPISSNFFNDELSALRVRINNNMEQLKQEFSKKLAQHESRCNCNEEINKIIEDFKTALVALQKDILQKTNSIVETTKTEVLSELNGAILLLRGQIDINKGQLVEIISHRLREKDERIDQLEGSLSAEIQKLQQKSEEVSRKLSDIVNDSVKPLEN